MWKVLGLLVKNERDFGAGIPSIPGRADDDALLVVGRDVQLLLPLDEDAPVVLKQIHYIPYRQEDKSPQQKIKQYVIVSSGFRTTP